MSDLTGYLSITEGALFDYAYGLDNYLIEYDEKYRVGNKCAIYFSGSGLYTPNTEDTFEQRVIKENRFEWYGHRLPGVYKHISVRDIAKQFYVWGINKNVDSMEKLVEFLKIQTDGMEIYTVGSSAGGYAAALVGSTLNAEMIYCFSGFFSLNHVNGDIWYLVSKYKESELHNRYYEVGKFIENTTAKIVYFYPALSEDTINNDSYQHTLVDSYSNVLAFGMNTRAHGITFPKYCLEYLWSKDWEELSKIHKYATPPMSIGKYILLCCGMSKTLYYLYQLFREKAGRLKRRLLKK